MADTIPTTFQIGAKVSPATAASNYQQSATSKGTKWATRYLSSKVDPFEAASAAGPTWLANLNHVGVAGYQAGLARVNRQRVAQLVSTSGPQLYNQGIQLKGAANYAAAATNLIPAIHQAAANLPPRGSDAANEQRMIDMRRALKSMRGLYRAK